MKALPVTLALVLTCEAALASTIRGIDYVHVTSTNASTHGVSVDYGSTNQVKFAMPYSIGKLSFYGADLEVTNSLQHFNIPVNGLRFVPISGKRTEPIVLVQFVMDRRTLRESSLKISFGNDYKKRAVYVILLRDFIPEDEPSREK